MSGAFHDGLSPVIKAFDAGGGMSAAENRMVNHRGKIIYNTGPPKPTNDGKDLSKNAKNKIKGPAGLLTEEQSPSSCSHSRNQREDYSGKGGGKNDKNKRYA